MKIGDKINMLTLISEPYSVLKYGKIRKVVNLECDCGNLYSCVYEKILKNNIISCGCIRKKKLQNGDFNRTHSLRKTDEYRIWSHIKDRCYNTKSKCYYNYGGRGIKMSDEWVNNFENFYYDMGQRPSNKHSIDRIDVNGDYCKENCQWATDEEQRNNKRNTRYLIYNQHKFSAKIWSKKLNVIYSTLKSYLLTHNDKEAIEYFANKNNIDLSKI